MRSPLEGTLERHDLLDSRQFMIAVRRLADSLAYGSDRSPFLGSGVEYVQSRPYQPGDPVRSIDWRVTARSRRVHVKEFESPKRLPCYLLFDTSASMTVSSHARSKYATALHVAGGLGLACLDRISPVGIVGVGKRALMVKPSLSKSQIMQWTLALRRFRYDEGTTLGQRIRELSPSLSHRALVVVLSDFHDDEALPALQQMAQRHDCVVLQFRDPVEDGIRGAGFVRGQEAETGREFVSHGRKRGLDQELIRAAFKRSGIDHLEIRTDRPFVHALRHFFESRGMLGRTAR